METTRFQLHHMNSVLVEAWEAFKVSYVNIIVDNFAKSHLLPLSPPHMITNTQACVASVQTFSKGINHIAEDTLAPIKLQVTRTDETFRLYQSTKHTHTHLHMYVKTYQTSQGNNYILHQMANRLAD